jgi:hypothetical protein
VPGRRQKCSQTFAEHEEPRKEGLAGGKNVERIGFKT